MPNTSPGEALKAAFGSDWSKRAARALGLSRRHIQFVAANRRPLTRRHLILLRHIARDRTGNANKELARRQAALAREAKAYLKAAAAADLVFAHLLEEEKRQGRMKKG